MNTLQQIVRPLFVCVGVCFGSFAFAADPAPSASDAVNVERHVERLQDGGYVETIKKEQVDAEGTDRTEKTVITVDTDKSGNSQKVIETQKTVDPKGLFNQTTETNRQVIRQESNKDGSERITETEHTNPAGTTYKNTETRKTNVDSGGNVDQEYRSESSRDPRGLMNKTSTEVQEKVDEERNSSTMEHNRKVNGDTVEDSKTQTQK